MSVEENKALFRRTYEELLNRGDLALADELVSPEFINHEGRSSGGTMSRRAPPPALSTPATKGNSSGWERQERKTPEPDGARTSAGKTTAQPSASARPLGSWTSPGELTNASPALNSHLLSPERNEPPSRSK